MRQKFLFFISVMLAFMLCQCSDKDKSTGEFNKYVAGYTSGQVSRSASVLLILSEEVSDEQQKKVSLSEVMSISPSVDGSYSFSDSHTIVFRPSGEMQYDTEYKVEADLEKLFDDADKFAFSFKTLPFQVSAALSDFSVEESGDYKYTFQVNTADNESVERVKSVIELKQGGSNVSNLTWEKKSDRSFNVSANIKFSSSTLDVNTIANSEYGLAAENLVTVDVPNPNQLSVFDVKCVNGDTRYIEVSFNKIMDNKQDMMGLAYIDDNTSMVVETEGNKLKLFPDLSTNGEVTVVLSENIRSKDGMILGSNITRKVDLKSNKPAVEFIGDGVIIPQTDKLVVPFRSIYMKGVRVNVFKIYANNFALWLQKATLYDSDPLRLYGRPIAATTFYMDETDDLSKWHNYSIDLSNLMKVEPGCMYRVELLMDYRLSAWPECENTTIDKTVFEREDKVRLATMNEDFDDGDNWYNIQEDWTGYSWKESEDPTKKSYYMGKSKGRNVFATNIGLWAVAPTSKSLTVVATDLLTAKGMSGVFVEAYNRQNQLIGKGETNADGRVDFSFDGSLGSPFIVLAKKDNDVSGLRVKRGEELSTSAFEVAGDVVQKGLKGYIYGERGVWRPGDTLFLSFILNDRAKTLPENHPVVMEISNPLGQSYKSFTKTDGKMGVYAFAVPTEDNIVTGSWLVNVQVGGTTFSKRIRIETIKPNRLKINLSLPKELVEGAQVYDLQAEWLNGAKTHNLKYEISTRVVKGTTKFDKWKDYEFDDCSKSFEAVETVVAEGKTDGNGEASMNLYMPKTTAAPGKLNCSVTTKVYEPSGEFSTDVQVVPFSPYKQYVGVKAPSMGDKWFLATGKNQKFEVASVDRNGVGVSTSLTVEVYKTAWWWWWNSTSEGVADYSYSFYDQPFKKETVKTDGNGKGSFVLNVKDKDWGGFLIRVTDNRGGHTACIRSYFDWPTLTERRTSDGGSFVTALSIQTDKKEYVAGDKMQVTIPSAQGGRAIVSVSNSAGIQEMKFVDCNAGNTTVLFDVTEEMLPNAYVSATLIQPYNHTKDNDMPIRLYGVAPISVSSESSKLTPVIESKDETKPLQTFEVKVKEEKGRAMAYTLAVVDEGLLDLTRFKTPNAWSAFFAKEAMSMRMWDLYSNVCGAFGGKIDQMFTVGGDEALYNGPKAIVNRFTPMVYFGGPFVVEKGKTNTHKIEVPNYSGRVRVMVVAADGNAYGSAEKSVYVRKSMMVTGTMPRQIGVGDETTISATVFAMDNSVKNVKTTISVSGGLEIVGSNTVSTDFSEQGDKTVQFKVKAGNQEGTGTVTINSTCSGDKSVYAAELPIRSVSERMVNSETFKIAAGKSEEKSIKALGNEKQLLSVEVSRVKPFNVASRVESLLDYPYASSECIASKALGQIYLMEFSQLTKDQTAQAEKNVKSAIESLAAYQNNEGAMAYWKNSGFGDRWTSAYVLLFLKKASEKGYYVNDKMLRSLTRYVQTQVRNWKSGSSDYEKNFTAFGLYVLASTNSSNAQELGTMNRMKAEVGKMAEGAQNYLAAAYASVGQVAVAKQILQSASADASAYRCPIASSRVIAQTLCGLPSVEQSVEDMRAELNSQNWMYCTDVVLSLHAASVYTKKNGTADELNFALSVNGKEFANEKTTQTAWSAQVAKDQQQVKVKVQNKSKATAYATAFFESWATQAAVPSSASGLFVKIAYTKDNAAMNLQSVEAGATYKAVVIVTNQTGKEQENVAITYVAPSGVEILKVANDLYNANIDQRDDRVYVYVDNLKKGQTTTTTLTLSATYAGNYYVPSTIAKCIYDNNVMGNTASGTMVVK